MSWNNMLVFLGHLDLVVAGKTINEREHCVMCYIVDRHIDVGQRKIILGAGPIKIPIVDEHMDTAVLLGYRDNICHPFQIVAY